MTISRIFFCLEKYVFLFRIATVFTFEKSHERFWNFVEIRVHIFYFRRWREKWVFLALRCFCLPRMCVVVHSRLLYYNGSCCRVRALLWWWFKPVDRCMHQKRAQGARLPLSATCRIPNYRHFRTGIGAVGKIGPTTQNFH